MELKKKEESIDSRCADAGGIELQRTNRKRSADDTAASRNDIELSFISHIIFH